MGLLRPFEEVVRERFEHWLLAQRAQGRTFSSEQEQWLRDMANHIAGNVEITPDDFSDSPFAQRGGLGKVWQLFGNDLNPLMDELNRVLVA